LLFFWTSIEQFERLRKILHMASLLFLLLTGRGAGVAFLNLRCRAGAWRMSGLLRVQPLGEVNYACNQMRFLAERNQFRRDRVILVDETDRDLLKICRISSSMDADVFERLHFSAEHLRLRPRTISRGTISCPMPTTSSFLIQAPRRCSHCQIRRAANP
jgi:hypothetical protein